MPIDLRPRGERPWRPPSPETVKYWLELKNLVRQAQGQPPMTFEESWAEAQIPPTQREKAQLARDLKDAQRGVAEEEARIKAGGPVLGG